MTGNRRRMILKNIQGRQKLQDTEVLEDPAMIDE